MSNPPTQKKITRPSRAGGQASSPRRAIHAAIGGRQYQLVPLLLDGGAAIQCRYHGLRFDGGGACVHNPHGPSIPPRARVRAYPVIERYGIAWIWMGDPPAADPASIPDFSFMDPASHHTAGAYMNVAGCLRRRYYSLVKWALLSPLYWGLMSLAAYKGFFQLFTNPFYWEKTVHGLDSAAGPVATSEYVLHTGTVPNSDTALFRTRG